MVFLFEPYLLKGFCILLFFLKCICDKNDIEDIDANPCRLIKFKSTVYLCGVNVLAAQNSTSGRKIEVAHKVGLRGNRGFCYDLLKALCAPVNTQSCSGLSS